MSDARRYGDETQVWQGSDIQAALGESRRVRKRGRATGGRGSRGWQVGWRLVLWAIALGLGWYAGTHYFG